MVAYLLLSVNGCNRQQCLPFRLVPFSAVSFAVVILSR